VIGAILLGLIAGPIGIAGSLVGAWPVLAIVLLGYRASVGRGER